MSRSKRPLDRRLLHLGLLLFASVLTAQPSEIVLSATVAPHRYIQLAVESPGVIEEFLVEEGQSVAEGEPILKLRSTGEGARVRLAQAMLSEAQAVFEITSRDFERSKQMLEDKLMSERDFEASQLDFRRAEAKLEQSRAQLALAQDEFDKKQLIAPVSGIWIRSLKQLGEAVSTREPMGILVDPSRLQAVFLCPPAFKEHVQPGSEIAVHAFAFDGETETTAQAIIDFVEPIVDPGSLRFRVRVSLDPAIFQPGQKIQLFGQDLISDSQ